MNIAWRSIVAGQVEYPPAFYELSDPPARLWALGAIPTAGVAIVGSRDGDDEALRFAFALARTLGRPVISGLARGIDAAAHRGALSGGRPTLAYVGTGIDRIYPAEHAGLQAEILSAGGGVATEQPLGVEADPLHLMQRDRLQAAHAAAVVLVVSEPTGGAMHTMRFARLLGRPRFALVPRGDGDAGNALAIRDGAVPLPWDVDGAREAIAQGLAAH